MKIGFVSLGCAKNLTDTEVMIGILKNAGHTICPSAEEAEVIIVNTCGFIESAKEESIETVLQMAEYKKENCKLLIMTGCLAQRYHDEIRELIPEVDAVCGTGEYTKIAEVIELSQKGEHPVLCSGVDDDIEENDFRYNTSGATAYLKIAEGCDNKCTYCIIPKLRGRYRSRKPEAIIKEAECLASEGVRELVVIAQDTSRYGMDLAENINLARLLKMLCKIEKIQWIRVLYLYPEAVTDELCAAFAEEEKIVPYIDMPIQHINNEVLKRMGRHTNREEIISVIDKLRKNIKNVTLRTSLIVGFPGETEEQFNELYEFVRAAQFERLGVFPYSKEEGTPAEKLTPQIKKSVKLSRCDKIMKLQSEISYRKQKEKIGTELLVITEGYDEESFMYYGRSAYDSPEVDTLVYFAAEDEVEIGSFANVLILDADEYDLTGKKV